MYDTVGECWINGKKAAIDPIYLLLIFPIRNCLLLLIRIVLFFIYIKYIFLFNLQKKGNYDNLIL